MARIEAYTGEVITEVVTPHISLRWNPIDDSGRVQFNMERLVSLDGNLISREPAGMLERSFDQIMSRVWEVPDGSGGVIQVPTTLLMGTIKVAFDVLYQESVSPPPEPEPEPEPEIEVANEPAP